MYIEFNIKSANLTLDSNTKEEYNLTVAGQNVT